MNWEQFQNGCDALVSISQSHTVPGAIQLLKQERKRLIPLATALLYAMTGKAPLPKRIGGRPRKHNMGKIGDDTLHTWHVMKFVDLVYEHKPIDSELFTKMSVAAFAVQYGADPEKAFSINEGRTETRGLSPHGKRKGSLLHELEVAIEVAKAVEVNKTYQNRTSKYGGLKTNIYNGVAKKFSISDRTVQDLYIKALSRAPGITAEEKNRWLSYGAVDFAFLGKRYKKGLKL